MSGPKTTTPSSEEEDIVAAAIDAAPYDERRETEEERGAVNEARVERDGFVTREEVARVLEAGRDAKRA